MPENDATANAGEQGERTEQANLPTTQEEFDRVVQKRIERERARYADYDELKQAAGKLAELEGAQKTEQERLVGRAEAAERELEASRYESLRLSVIARNEVPEKYQHLVRGTDEDELSEAAKAVAELVAESAKPKTGGRVVVDDLDAGTALNGGELEDALRRSLGIN